MVVGAGRKASPRCSFVPFQLVGLQELDVSYPTEYKGKEGYDSHTRVRNACQLLNSTLVDAFDSFTQTINTPYCAAKGGTQPMLCSMPLEAGLGSCSPKGNYS